ncbi:MAG: hypothetical protein J0L62_07650 [Bacteroidetes bacterium]|nr:hypothetical protein [Bacteroidota bacterium]
MNDLYEIFTAYYHQAVDYADQHEFKKSSESFEKAFDVLNEIRSEALRKYAGKKITRVKTQEEVDLERLKGVVLDLRNRVGDLYLELDDLELDLGKFQTEYNARVGKFFIELDQAEYAINLMRLKFERYHSGKAWDDESISQELSDFKKQLETDENQLHEDEKNLREFIHKNRELSEDQKRELRSLYRDLAKIYHPDKARTDEEKSYFEDVMKEINEAYHHSNLDSLKKIDAKAQLLIEVEQIGESLNEKLSRLGTEERKLSALISSISKRTQELRSSDTYALFIKVQNFQPSSNEYFLGVIDDLEQRIKRKKVELARLKEQFSVLTSKSNEKVLVF